MNTAEPADLTVASDVFVSYARVDREKFRPLVHELRSRGLLIWWDADIPTRAPWEATITRHHEAARKVLVIWTHASIVSENVRAEARRARDQRKLVQTFGDDCHPPLFFGERQGIDLVPWLDHRDSRTLDLLVVRLMSDEPPSLAQVRPSRSWLAWTRGRLPTLAGYLLALTCGWLLRDIMQMRSAQPPKPDAHDTRGSSRDLVDVLGRNLGNGAALSLVTTFASGDACSKSTVAFLRNLRERLSRVLTDSPQIVLVDLGVLALDQTSLRRRAVELGPHFYLVSLMSAGTWQLLEFFKLGLLIRPRSLGYLDSSGRELLPATTSGEELQDLSERLLYEVMKRTPEALKSEWRQAIAAAASISNGAELTEISLLGFRGALRSAASKLPTEDTRVDWEPLVRACG